MGAKATGRWDPFDVFACRLVGSHWRPRYFDAAGGEDRLRPRHIEWGRGRGDTVEMRSREVVGFETKIVQELGRGRAGVLEIPGLVKDGMVGVFHNARRGIEVQDVHVRRRITEEDASKVMFVKFTAAGTSHLHTDPGPKTF